MNTSNIKKYAPKARIEFMDAVTKRLNSFGISQTKGTASNAGELRIAEAVVQGSVLQIDGNSFDSALAEPRRRLVVRSEQLGFAQLVEQEAYTWFNRLCAIRYMEIHDYLGHGFRVLSHPDNPTGFEIIDHAVDAADELDLDRDYIVELKLAGNKDEILYRELLLKQCHKLHQAMPFLFEALNDASELLLPDNLTRTDSILRGLVDGIPEEDWQQVEVIGWLYQFYISEKKDEVIGKVVKSEDIPAATQLFTPNWIVKYLVQNSVGRQWLQTYPESPIKSQMKYYIEPAEQSAEVNEQLQAITPESIEPESIKVLDPAVGSGHILIEAYNVLKAIYEERGYRPREIPKLILENNLYGLDIDDRAAQLSGFALMMMAREDDKRIFTRNVRLNVLALQEGNHINLPAEWRALNLSGGWETGAPQDMFADETQDLSSFEADNRYQLLQRTLARFTQAKTFGSLIDVPADEYDDLKEIHETLSELAESGDSFQRPAAKQLIDIVHQALILSIRYDAVIANPPYMGSKYQTVEVRKYLKDNFRGYEKDLFSAYIIRNLQLAKENGQLGFMTPFVWMFLTSYEQLRNKLIDEETISTLIQLEYSGFDGATVPICTFTLTKGHLSGYTGSYIKLSDFRGAVNQAPKTLEAINNTNCGWFYKSKPDDFKKIPGSPIAYWASENDRDAFIDGSSLDEIAPPRLGMATGNNDIYLRLWHEVSLLKCGFELESREDALTSRKKWFPYNKGGEYRRWYGNCDYLVDWENDGQKLQTTMHASGTRLWAHNFNLEYIFKPSITWTATSSSYFAVRKSDPGFLFDVKGSSCFPHEGKENLVLGFLCSSATQHFMKILNPTIEFQPGNIASLCLPENKFDETAQNVEQVVIEAVQLAREDWNRYEISWNFLKNPLIELRAGLKLSVSSHIQDLNKKTDRLHHLEYLNNLNFVEALDLDKYLAESLDKSLITLKGNPAYRFKKIDDIKELNSAFISSLKTELISYSIGCMLGRYSLDREGLVYANSGNQDFDELVAEGAYKSFPADQNAIIPLTDQEWFKDDATDRLREFVQVVWGSEHLQENLDFIAESLCLHAIKPKKSESSLETIRRYLSTQFYKDHLKTYKKRPIYWLFSSGKHKAFECLVYLHRYNEGTLSRMRTEYVTPLLGKYDAYAEQLEKQVETAESTSDSNRFKKELATLAKQQVELREFDDKLKHYADMRISLDLDDGVKVNYGKFGDLLADVKAITGSAPEMK